VRPDVPKIPDAYESVDNRLEAEGFLELAWGNAPPHVAEALTHVYAEDRTLTEAAEAVGMDPRTLRRAIARWSDDQNLMRPD
jgi:DNA-directed RNA polymerase specialized sigma24 family protein